MNVGDTVIWLPEPWKHGHGEIKGLTPHGWLWIAWADGHFDSHDPQTLEHATVWEERVLGTAA